MELMIALLLGGAVFLGVVYLVRARALRPAESRLRHLQSPSHEVALSQEDGDVALLRRDPSKAVVSRMLSTSRYADRWQNDLDRADLKLRPAEYFLLRMLMAVVVVLLVTAIGRNGIAFVISLPLAFIGYMLPAYWVRGRMRRRLSSIDSQLEETITLVANSLRAGFAFSQGLDVAAKRIGPPMSQEIGRVLLDINLGKSTEDALVALNERVGSDDMDMFVTAILVQRQSGGNLAEVLESVAATIRERERIKGEIKTLTAAQRFTAWILSLWPATLALVFYLINPDIMSLMWTTSAGIVLMVIWATLNVLGVITLQRILAIDV
jgi:tight adherence protein B